jgi:DNA invertase Pin-like site-specific DNA recombinase
MQISYIRTSTKEQEPELQIADIKKLCPTCDLTFYKEKLSAWKENIKRPVFAEVVSLIKAGRVQHLYVWDLDRIFRNRLRLKEFFLLCKTYNTKIHTVNQTWLEDIHKIPPPFNDMVFDLLLSLFGWIGEEESTKKSNRVKNAIVKSKKGTFSYKGNRWGRKPFPKQTVDRVLELAKTGLSIREIAKQIVAYEKNGTRKKMGKSTVQKILASNRS